MDAYPTPRQVKALKFFGVGLLCFIAGIILGLIVGWFDARASERAPQDELLGVAQDKDGATILFFSAPPGCDAWVQGRRGAQARASCRMLGRHRRGSGLFRHVVAWRYQQRAPKRGALLQRRIAQGEEVPAMRFNKLSASVSYVVAQMKVAAMMAAASARVERPVVSIDDESGWLHDDDPDCDDYAQVICYGGHGEGIPACGPVKLTLHQYNAAMAQPHRPWSCPNCGGRAEFDDDFFEQRHPEAFA